MKRWKRYRYSAAVFCLILLFVCLTGCRGNDGDTGNSNTETFGKTQKTTIAAPQKEEKDGNKEKKQGNLQVTMLNVGQGLSLLIRADGKTMIYDGGGREASSYVVSYLKKHKVGTIDYMVASHYDEDHIAGLVGVLYNTAVKQIICPGYETDTAIYASLQNAMKKEKAKIVHPEAGDTFPLGKARIQILSAEDEMEKDNDRSIAVRLIYGKTAVLITGDCEEAAEEQMISRAGKKEYHLKSDLYVAGHHGSASSSTKRFVKAVDPSVVWISCGADNSYGHPAKRTMAEFKAMDTLMYRTDLQGEVTLTSDGTKYHFSKKPCKDFTPGEKDTSQIQKFDEEDTDSGTGRETSANNVSRSKTGNAQADQDAVGDYKYILNTRSKLIHDPDCDSVDKMSEKNKEYTNLDRETLISQGYRPCGNCHP